MELEMMDLQTSDDKEVSRWNAQLLLHLEGVLPQQLLPDMRRNFFSLNVMNNKNPTELRLTVRVENLEKLYEIQMCIWW